MKRTLTLAVVLGLVSWVSVAEALTTVTLRDSTAPYSSVKVAEGAGWSGNLYVEIYTTVSLVSGQFFIRLGSQDNSMVTINSVTWNATEWDSPSNVYNPTMAYGFGAGSGWSSPNLMTDEFGALADDSINGTSTGTFLFLTLNVTLNAAADVGAYQLQLTDLIFGDTSFNEVTLTEASTRSNFTIVVMPAPGAVILGALGLSAVGAITRRRRAAKAA